MLDYGKRNLLGVLINAVDYETAVEQVIAAAERQQTLTIAALAVHGVMTGVLNPSHRYRLNRLDLVVPDGQPVRWALNWLYRLPLADRVYGPTLMLKLCDRAAQAGLPIYLYGSRPQVLTDLAQNLRTKFPRLIIAGSTPSKFRSLSAAEKQATIQTIQNSQAAMVFVGLGCPRQEVWLYEYAQHLPMPLLAVGAAFDFHAGHLSQAPAYLQSWGLEWFYRLCQEPRRLWKRYVIFNSLFVSLFLLQWLQLRRFDPQPPITPPSELNYG